MKSMAPAMTATLIIAAGLCACAHGGAAGPAAVNRGAAPTPAPDPLSAVIHFYQGPLNHLSSVRRGECPMAPSCAEYARQAIAAHGALVGWVMAHDRLMRCGRDETKSAARVLVGGKWKFYDPVSANDFWWRSGE